ncbi:tetratricopeptide repeat-containing protein [Pyxidicoccus caerfyrddinensis]|uniref:tetratricopeptide repeat-containing protein n=1 Tax=Pyxidicoccus caerfyrddinensis TaxID=2709663 RepID=UPI0013DA90CB|nr:tetratricopeptide repeat-containing protein [Pyxidicoccus caerfyrddinensis]
MRDRSELLEPLHVAQPILFSESIHASGPAPEPCGILGRIYKDLWEESLDAKREDAREVLDLAIQNDVRGFEARVK